MRKTLYLKFILAYILFGFFGFVVVSSFVSNMLTDHLIKEKTQEMYREATIIANTYANDLYNSQASLDTVSSQIGALSQYMEAVIWIINPSGRMILDSSTMFKPDSEVVVEGFDPSITAENAYARGDFFGSFDEEMLSVLAPISGTFKIHGYVIIHYPMSRIESSCNGFLNICYIMLVILFLLSMIILIFFTEMVYIPLRKITEATEQYASGNMHYEFSVDSEDEIGYLAATLSYMAGEIARADDDQKKFVANVSHDFRSPLTSMHGYLEAMQDGTIPPEMHQKYLGIVLNETDRLTKLTNSLLTLNNLNTSGMLLDVTDWDVNSAIRNVAATFGGTCMERGITFDLILTGETLYVRADRGKIEQVLYNICDNAVKFSHNDSVITIETTEKHNKVFVSVKDTGIGIPKDDLKSVWDRFYKSDLSRGKDKKGTGLGLSITKEIIRAHDEQINVISTEGAGTEFIFTLPVSEADYDDEDGDI